MADLPSLISDLESAFKCGSNDSTTMATLISTAINKYCLTLKVETGITITASGTGNMGLPVASTGQTTTEGTLK